MSTILVACQTITDEVNKAIQETAFPYPVVWIESGLHNFPDKLKARLQDQLDKITNVQNIILAFGYCGNSLLGLSSGKARLIIPRVDDCISLLLGSYQRRMEIAKDSGTYFLTKGWLEYENNIVTEYERCVAKYGEERAIRVFKMMLEHYRKLVLIDTGAYCLDDCLKKSCALAKIFGLAHHTLPGSLTLIKKLLVGPWDNEFVVLEPGQVITMDTFNLHPRLLEKNQPLFGFGGSEC